MDAQVCIYREFLVRYHVAVEIGTNHMRESPGRQSSLGMHLIRFPFLNHPGVPVQVFAGLTDFLMLALRRVGIHKRQAYIRLRHDE